MLSHVLLHVGLCGAVSRLPVGAPVAMRVLITYPVRPPLPDTQLDRIFRFTRDEDPTTDAEFDLPRGIYRLQLSVPKEKCSGSDYLEILADHNRTIDEQLNDAGAPGSPTPLLLLDGSAPMSFLYAKPTFVLFDTSVTCNAPVTAPLPSRITVENDPDGYYVWIYPDPSLSTRASVVLALRVRTPTGLYHYVRVPVTLRTQHSRWPDDVRFDATEDELDGLATEKTDTLLCPKLWETRVSG